jgi:hypothetical protein
MRKAAIIICTMISIVFPFARESAADEVILTTGDRFTSSKVWEEDGKVLFDMQGLIVKVDKQDVAAVIRDPRVSDPSLALPGQSAPGGQGTAPSALNHQPEDKPAAPMKSADPASHHPKPKVRGIGFDGLAWQMHPGEIAGIAKLGTDPSYGGIDQYWRPDSNLTLGDVLLDGLVFGFWQNRLYTIMVWVDGKPAYNRLQRTVFDRYGSGRKNEKGLERYIWIDDTTDRMLEFDEQRNTGIFWMRSRDLDLRVKQLYPEKQIVPIQKRTGIN